MSLQRLISELEGRPLPRTLRDMGIPLRAPDPVEECFDGIPSQFWEELNRKSSGLSYRLDVIEQSAREFVCGTIRALGLDPRTPGQLALVLDALGVRR
jgi:hypothetical protein